jgi:hypothetical protein
MLVPSAGSIVPAPPPAYQIAGSGLEGLSGRDVANLGAMNSTANGTMPECALYGNALARLAASGISFLIGGAFALERYTGIARNTKDLDIFLRPRDLERTLAELGTLGCRIEVPFPHWLAKAVTTEGVIDFIFSSGNGVAQVDDVWFEHAIDALVLDVPVKLCPPEETIWSKALIMERERYDGADVAHLLRALGPCLDWRRLVWRFGPHWRVLLSHLVLFGFVYPGERWRVPDPVMRELMGRLAAEVGTVDRDQRLCCGTLLSRAQYLPDIQAWGYRDARLAPTGSMTADDVARWTAGIDDHDSPSVAA